MTLCYHDAPRHKLSGVYEYLNQCSGLFTEPLLPLQCSVLPHSWPRQHRGGQIRGSACGIPGQPDPMFQVVVASHFLIAQAFK